MAISFEALSDTAQSIVSNQSQSTKVDKPAEVTEAVTETPPKTEPKVDNSKSFGALARRETQVVRQTQELKAKEQALADKEKRLTEFESAKADGNYTKALELIGLSYEQLTQLMLTGDKKTPDMIAREAAEIRIKEWQDAQAKRDVEQAEKLKAQEQENLKATIEEFKAEVSSFVDANEKDYELLKFNEEDGSKDLVLATIEVHWQNQKKLFDESKGAAPKVMDTKTACDLVEKFYKDKETRLLELRKSKSAASKADPNEAPKLENTAPSRTPTINNNLTSSAPSLLPAKTEQDRINRALAALSR